MQVKIGSNPSSGNTRKENSSASQLFGQHTYEDRNYPHLGHSPHYHRHRHHASRCVFDASPDTAKRLIDLGRKNAEKTLLESGLANAKDVAGGAMGMATNIWHKRPKLPFGKGKDTQTR